jgi:hypothetical protein
MLKLRRLKVKLKPSKGGNTATPLLKRVAAEAEAALEAD